jgi:hypothetical protein
MGDRQAFRVRVSGSAFYSGSATFIVEAGDALQDGIDLDAAACGT